MPRVSQYSHESKVAAVRRCAAETGQQALWLSRYGHWHRSIADRAFVPSSQVMGPTAALEALCEEAGVEFVRRRPSNLGRNPAYTRRMKLDAVQQFADAVHPEALTRDRYEAWRKTQPGPVPSPAALKGTFGTWGNVLKVVNPDYVAPVVWQVSWNLAADLDMFLAIAEGELGERPSWRAWRRLRKEQPELGLPSADAVKNRMKWSEFVDPDRVRNV